MARSMWNGALTIGGVAIPVKVFAATEAHTPRFRELHAKDGAPIEHRRVSSKSGREIAAEHVVKGYETSPGRWIVLTDAEIKAVERPERKAIELEDFVPADQIDPVFYDRAYHLGAQKTGRDAFAALLRALERTGLVGIGRVVLRTKEQLVAVRPGDGVLRMSTMRFADELVGADELDVDAPRRGPTKAEVDMAEQLVEGLAGDFDPGDFEDAWRERVDAYAGAKAKGAEPDVPEPGPAPEETDDLLDALKASMEHAGGRRRRATSKPAKRTARR